MKNLLIVGARGFGREVYSLAKQCHGYKKDFIIKGFLDDDQSALEGFENYPPIICSVEDYQVEESDLFIIALGAVAYKKKYSELVIQKGGAFISLVHPTSIINDNVIIGEGVIIGQYSTISNNVVIGNHVTVQNFSAFGHDVKTGDYCSFGAFTFLGGFVEIEELVTLHPRSSVLPHKKVKRGAIVGAGSVVIRNVLENVTVHGNPATILFSEKVG